MTTTNPMDKLVDLVGELLSQMAPLLEPEEPKANTASATRSNRPKLTSREVTDIREMKRKGLSSREIAEIYDVNRSTISRTLNGTYHRRAI